MLRIKSHIIKKIYEQGKKEIPLEACGYLVGTDNQVVESYAMYNVDQSEEHFTLDPAEQFKVIKDARSKGLEVLAVYHTHPVTPARPSAEDIRLAFDPNIIYVIGSLAEPEIVVKAFRIINSEVTPVEIIIE